MDIQYDFLPGGALAVPHGEEVIPVANRIMPSFPLVIASQDWHPWDHASFAKNHPGKKPGDVIDLGGFPQVLWPPHCVQRSHGAELAEELDRAKIVQIFRKGMDPEIDSYSAFFDNGHRKSTGLSDYLKERDGGPLYVMGLATDYCVKHTALDAIGEGFATTLIEDGCRGVELQAGDCDRALSEMQAAGVRILKSDSLSFAN